MGGLLRPCGRVALAAGICAGLVVPALASGQAAAASRIAVVSAAAARGTAPAVPGEQEWVSRYNGPGNSYDEATAMAVSPDGSTVFVTGWSDGADSLGDYATVAYDAATGNQEWASRYDGPASELDVPEAIAVSPDGETVFVTGYSTGDSSTDYATIAYDAATGDQLWMARYSGVTASVSYAKSLVVSHNGQAVYVTGYSKASSGNDYVTIGYNAATGTTLWTARYNGRANGNDQARAIAISPNDKMIFVTGRSTGIGFDDATVAYNAATGARLWTARYNNRKANGNEFANAITVGPGGQTVYITGGSKGKSSYLDYATIAYKVSTGTQLWVARYNGPGNLNDSGAAVAITPNGATIIVTGSSWGTNSNTDYATIAYNARTGASRWTKRYATVPGGYDSDNPAGVVISPDGGTVYVTGDSENTTTEDDYATVAYSTATGARQWVTRYDGPQHSFDGATALALSPSGDTLYVTGFSTGTTSATDFATVAYQT